MYAFYFWLMAQSEAMILLTAFGLTLLGALTAWISGAGHRLAPMGRAHFFLALASVLVVINLNEVGFSWMDRAFVSGWLPLLLTAYLAILFANGFLLSMISHARSRDLCGSGRLSWVTFVPFGIFYMLFQPGAAHRAAEHSPHLKQGTGKIVAFGFLIWIAGRGLGLYVEDMEMQPLSGEETLRFQSVWIEKRGIETYFKEVAEDSKSWLPSEPEPGVLLIEIVAAGPLLTYKYVVHDPEIYFDETSEQVSDAWACAIDAFGDALRAGGRVESLYVDPQDVTLFDHVTHAEDCPEA